MKYPTLEDLIEELRQHRVSQKTLEAMRIIKREFFVVNKEEAYLNEALPFYSQTTSQPLVIANVIDALELTNQDIVLEVGTGSGFQTCLIAFFAQEVHSFEIDPEIYQVAKQNIEKFLSSNPNLKMNIELYRKDIFKAKDTLDEIQKIHGRIDKAVFSFAIKEIPTFIQDKINLIIAPIEESGNYQKLKKIEKKEEGIFIKDLGYVSFVRARTEK